VKIPAPATRMQDLKTTYLKTTHLKAKYLKANYLETTCRTFGIP
jgi:hypothetical protein